MEIDDTAGSQESYFEVQRRIANALERIALALERDRSAPIEEQPVETLPPLPSDKGEAIIQLARQMKMPYIVGNDGTVVADQRVLDEYDRRMLGGDKFD